LAIFAMWYITRRDQILYLPKLRLTVQVWDADQCFDVRIGSNRFCTAVAIGRSESFVALVKKVCGEHAV
jgi:hypothetical protein